MIEELIKDIITKDGCRLQEANLFSSESNLKPYWYSSIMDRKGFPVSGGFGEDRIYSRKVAIAEYLERFYCRKFKNESLEEFKKWGFDVLPTACGFAAGFDAFNTRLRSIHEAAERWVMSKWIDDHFYIDEVSIGEIRNKFSEASSFFLRQFDNVKFYRKDIVISVDGKFVIIEVAQTMGFKDCGIYPGSSAQAVNGCLWEHALLESFRHLQAVKNNPNRNIKFPDNKVYYFSKNASVAMEQISLARKREWEKPKIKFHHYEPIMNGQAYLSRTIFDGWRSWHEGPLERFLY